MAVKITESSGRVHFREEELTHIRAYPEAYGLDVEQVERLRQRFDAGEDVRRIGPAMRMWDIEVTDVGVVGSLTLSLDSLGNQSVSIAVWDQYARRGFAKAALRELVDLLKSERVLTEISADIEAGNPQAAAVEALLRSVGFAHDSLFGGWSLEL